MKVVPQSVTLEQATHEPALLIERAARNCYKSEDLIGPGSADRIIRKLMTPEDPHHSVLEHASATVRVVCDRGIMAELTRHRLGSFSIESTRYCNYGKDKFGNEITVIEPPGLSREARDIWHQSCVKAEADYFALLEAGVKPELARSVLPTCLKTEIVWTQNARSWLHTIKMRASHRAHPQVREIASEVDRIMRNWFPEVFGPAQFPEVSSL